MKIQKRQEIRRESDANTKRTQQIESKNKIKILKDSRKQKAEVMEIQENRRQKMSERQNPGIIITVNPPLSPHTV